MYWPCSPVILFSWSVPFLSIHFQSFECCSLFCTILLFLNWHKIIFALNYITDKILHWTNSTSVRLQVHIIISVFTLILWKIIWKILQTINIYIFRVLRLKKRQCGCALKCWNRSIIHPCYQWTVLVLFESVSRRWSEDINISGFFLWLSWNEYWKIRLN